VFAAPPEFLPNRANKSAVKKFIDSLPARYPKAVISLGGFKLVDLLPAIDGKKNVTASYDPLQDDRSTAGIPILVVTAREVTSLDRQVLNADPSQAVRIIEKAGLNRSDFMAEVRRALRQD